LLSKRLKDLEEAGVVERSKVTGESGVFEYRLTKSGRDLGAVVQAVGIWGHKWIETKASLDNLDPNLLMWDMRRNIDPRPMPPRRSVIQFIFADLPASKKNWWLIVGPGTGTDLCSVDPGFDVDLYVSTDVRTMTQVWMGYVTLAQAKRNGRLTTTGDRQLEATMKNWLSLSPFAKYEKCVA
jgi:hypothetical protein